MKEQSKGRQEIIREAAGKLLEMFETGKMPEAVAFSIIRRRASDDQPSFHWSFGNQVLMYAQGTLDARGFGQWKLVSRYVKKGASAIWILAPLTRRVEKEDGTVDNIIIGFKTVPVFSYESTEGRELVRSDYTPPELPPLWDVAERLGVDVQYAPLTANYYGKFNPRTQQITLCTSNAGVYFHELAHAVHGTFNPLTNGQDAEQEIVAETAACVLCELQGVQGYQNQAYEYLKRYTAQMQEESVVRAIMRVLNDVEQVVERILEIAEESQRCPEAITA